MNRTGCHTYYALHLTELWDTLVDLYFEIAIKAMRADTPSVFEYYRNQTEIILNHLKDINEYLNE